MSKYNHNKGPSIPHGSHRKPYWMDVPVKDVEQAVVRSLKRNSKRRVNTMALGFVNALTGPVVQS